MFTGIVRERGRVVAVEGDGQGARLRLEAPLTAAAQAALGDSVAVAGVCLTVVAVDGEELAFDAVAETLARTLARPPRAPATRSTSSRRSAPASRSAATTSRATSTASARPRGRAARATGAA